MKILIIARGFAPDNVIGAVRVSKFAKHLSCDGNVVYVICSGIIAGKEDPNIIKGLENVEIFHYEKGQKTKIDLGIHSKPEKENRGSQNSEKIRRFLKDTAHIFYDPIKFYHSDGFIIKKKIIQCYEKHNELRGFDSVIATFSPYGCLQAGLEISRKEGSVYIVDFRDLMTNQIYTPLLRIINRIIQGKIIHNADGVLCVSKGNTEVLKRLYKVDKDKIFTVYNGFDGVPTSSITDTTNRLSICYTGTLYNGMRDLKPLFRAIKIVFEDNINCVQFIYAGNDSDTAKKQAEECGISSIVVDYGFVDKETVAKIQKESDLFLVVTWNTSHENGILTGKFYESLLYKKPVIGLVGGDVPNSELRTMIEDYSLGVCYEEADSDKTMQNLCDYLKVQYKNKLQRKQVIYNPDETVFGEFSYSGISRQLEGIIKRLSVKSTTFLY